MVHDIVPSLRPFTLSPCTENTALGSALAGENLDVDTFHGTTSYQK